jgi:hypothetical protein
VSDEIYVQYVGFESKASVRQYTFCVRETSNKPREFILSIANEAFVSHRVRYQDAPDICSLKLRRELAMYGNHPPKSHFVISEEDLANYRDIRAKKARPSGTPSRTISGAYRFSAR